MGDELTKAEEVAKEALGISWWDTESAARRVAEYAADRIEELEAALKDERNKALREAADKFKEDENNGIWHFAHNVPDRILALITDDEQPAPETVTLWGYEDEDGDWEFRDVYYAKIDTHKITGTIEKIEKE